MKGYIPMGVCCKDDTAQALPRTAIFINSWQFLGNLGKSGKIFFQKACTATQKYILLINERIN